MFSCVPVTLSLAASFAAPVRADQTLYTDSLQNSWQNWSWATVNLASPSPIHAGAEAISVKAPSYAAFYLHHDPQATSADASLTFWINGGPVGGQSLQVQATLSGVPQKAYALPALLPNAWVQVVLPLAALGVAGNAGFDGFWIQDTSGQASVPAFFVDDINLASAPPPPPGPVKITVDAGAGRHAISPLIYGVAYGEAQSLADLNAPLNRLGGNNTSRYNWSLDADNKASDYFFESIGDTPVGQTLVPGKRGDTFIAASQAGGAQAMLTIPTIGWVAKLAPNGDKLASFSVAKYGKQQSTDPYFPDAGNGVFPGGTLVTGNDPHDANVVDSADSEAGWISHLTAKWGTASQGGLSYYLLDNEPSLWFSTHRDVHPVGPTMDEIKNDILTYGAKVKALDPSASVVGPEEWGWSGYFYSGFDQQYLGAHNYQGHPDRDAHGGQDYLPWLLDQLHQNDLAIGKRLLDVFSVHFYPQGGEFSNAVDSATVLRRSRSTRQLWDPNYVSESWINDKVMLIPRLRNWVNTYYPGTKIGLTEYNWGAEGDMNGATTQADIYGIFGREGLDLATRWIMPATGSPVYLAMKLYRNYDGHKSSFGDLSVSDTAPDPDTVSSFAAVRSGDGALTITVINKNLSASAPVTLSLANFNASRAAQAWQLTSAGAITRLTDLPVTAGALTITVPAESVTLLVIPPAAPAPQTLFSAADTYVRSGTAAAQNFGTATTLMLQKSTSATVPSSVVYVKFDLTGIKTAPATAKLALTFSSLRASIPAPGLVYGIGSSSWDERTLTWNSAVVSESLNADGTSGGTAIASTAVISRTGLCVWDVSSYLKDKAGQIVTLQVLMPKPSSHFGLFQSRRAVTGRPTLRLSF